MFSSSLQRLGAVSVPALVIENGADDACTPSHTRRIVDGFRHGEVSSSVTMSETG